MSCTGCDLKVAGVAGCAGIAADAEITRALGCWVVGWIGRWVAGLLCCRAVWSLGFGVVGLSACLVVGRWGCRVV